MKISELPDDVDLRDMVCESCDRLLNDHAIHNTTRGIVVICLVEIVTKGTYTQDAKLLEQLYKANDVIRELQARLASYEDSMPTLAIGRRLMEGDR